MENEHKEAFRELRDLCEKWGLVIIPYDETNIKFRFENGKGAVFYANAFNLLTWHLREETLVNFVKEEGK